MLGWGCCISKFHKLSLPPTNNTSHPKWVLPSSPFPWPQQLFHPLSLLSLNFTHLFVPSVFQLQLSSTENSPLSPLPHAPPNPPPRRFLIPTNKTKLFSLLTIHPTPFSESATRYYTIFNSPFCRLFYVVHRFFTLQYNVWLFSLLFLCFYWYKLISISAFVKNNDG
jgi:hypothetical protein